MKRRKWDRNQDTCRSPGIGRTHHEQRTILSRNSRLEIHCIQATRPRDWYPESEPDRPSPIGGGIIRSRIRVDTDITPCHLQPCHELPNHQRRLKTTTRIIVEMKVQAATLDNRASRGIYLYRQPLPPSRDAAPRVGVDRHRVADRVVFGCDWRGTVSISAPYSYGESVGELQVGREQAIKLQDL